MPYAIRSIAALLLIAAAVAGCGQSRDTGADAAPAFRIEHVRGGSAERVVLSPQGAARIGVQTVAATRAGGDVSIPYGAVVYDANGRTYVFTSPAPLTYTEVPVGIRDVAGDRAHLSHGPPAGSTVVSVGAEELFGVVTGVLAQT